MRQGKQNKTECRRKSQNNLQVNPHFVIHRHRIWTSTNRRPADLPGLSNKAKGTHVHSQKTIEKTLKPFDEAASKPTWERFTSRKEGKKFRENIWSHVRVRRHSHVQNTPSLQYTSGGKHREGQSKDNLKKTPKKQNKITMYLATPRGTQCDTLCIIASIFPLIFATEWREKVNFVLRWHFVSWILVILNVVQ